jgi:hypothetical protein
MLSLPFTCLLGFLCRQKACHGRTAYWAGTLDHAGAFGCGLDLTVLDGSLGPAFDAISFELHGIVSSGKQVRRALRYPHLGYIILVLGVLRQQKCADKYSLD